MSSWIVEQAFGWGSQSYWRGTKVGGVAWRISTQSKCIASGPWQTLPMAHECQCTSHPSLPISLSPPSQKRADPSPAQVADALAFLQKEAGLSQGDLSEVVTAFPEVVSCRWVHEYVCVIVRLCVWGVGQGVGL